MSWRNLKHLLIAQAVWAAPFDEARADDERWLLALEAGAGRALSAPQSTDFGFGASGSLALYRTLSPWVSLGAAARATVLPASGSRSDPSWADVQLGGLYSLAASLRLAPFSAAQSEHRALGLWLEGNSGGAITADKLRPVVGGAVGYNLSFGDIAVGPMARFEQLVEFDDPLSDEDARVLIGGFQITFLDSSPKPPLDQEVRVVAETEPSEAPMAPPEPVAVLDADADADGVLDEEDGCPEQPETANGFNDHDGCPDETRVEFVNDRLVLEGRILFGFNRSRLRKKAGPMIEAIADAFKTNPDWLMVRIEGHADVRGNPDYNLRLSHERAAAVERALIAQGIDPAMLKTKGYGEARPLDLRRIRSAHRRNRRVEFVVVRKRELVREAGVRATATAEIEGGVP